LKIKETRLELFIFVSFSFSRMDYTSELVAKKVINMFLWNFHSNIVISKKKLKSVTAIQLQTKKHVFKKLQR